MAAGGDAVGAGVGGRPTLGVDHAELADGRLLVACYQRDHPARPSAGAKHLEPHRPEADVDRCLRRDRADPASSHGTTGPTPR